MDKEYLDKTGLLYFWGKIKTKTGVSSFNGRTGAVTPQSGDYTAAQVGAVPTTRTINGKKLSGNITLKASDVGALPIEGGTLTGDLTLHGDSTYGNKINFGDGDLVHISEPTDDCLEIKAKKIDFVISDTSDSRFTINGVNPFGSSGENPNVSNAMGTLPIEHGGTGSTTASAAICNLTKDLPTRTAASINSYASRTFLPIYYESSGYKVPISNLMTYINNNITAASVDLSGYVPTTRTINGKALSSNITLTADDIGISGLVGKSMAGESVRPTSGSAVTAGEGAEIFNDYRSRIFSDGNAMNGNVASGMYSHAEGVSTTASGVAAHAEGISNISSGSGAHTEGDENIASGAYSHAEGMLTKASEFTSHAEGMDTESSGQCSHAEGHYGIASGDSAHAEGSNCKATGDWSHAEGASTTAEGNYAHSGGYQTKANGSASVSTNWYTIANADYQTAIGAFNKSSTSSTDRFIAGKGASDTSRANCFRITDTGVYATGNYSSTGADYAELFEWKDGNPKEEDRIGRFVTLDGEKIRLAAPEDDFILGVVSGNPSVLGDVHDEQWNKMYLTDIFGRPIWEEIEFPEITVEERNPENPKEIITRVASPAKKYWHEKLNPDYDNTQEYIPRTERYEWDAVGMLGKLVVIDDGTCDVNGWATVGENGIATYSEQRTKYRVMKRLDTRHIHILIV